MQEDRFKYEQVSFQRYVAKALVEQFHNFYSFDKPKIYCFSKARRTKI